MEQNTLYVDGKPVGTIAGISVEGDFAGIERRAIDCADAEPQGATTGRRPYQTLLAASAVLSASPFERMLEHMRSADLARLQGREATSVIIDELDPTSVFNNQLAFYAELQLGGGWLWVSHRTRNLSHRPVAGARKRKAALKYAARQHRAVVRFS